MILRRIETECVYPRYMYMVIFLVVTSCGWVESFCYLSCNDLTLPVVYLLTTDCLLYQQVNAPNDAAILQQHLHNLQQWAESGS